MSALRWFSLLSFLAASLFPLGLNLPPVQTAPDQPALPLADHYGRAVENNLRMDASVVQPSSQSPEIAAESSSSLNTNVEKWSKVVFQRYLKNWEIMLVNADGTGLTRLTNRGATDAYPELNKGTTRVTFLSNQDGPDFDIWVMNVDGTKQTDLTQNKADEDPATWSPDGNWLAFPSNRDGNWEIYRMHPDGTQVTRLTYSPGADFSPTWSPDGSQIAWVHAEPGSSTGAIWIMDASGANPVQIVSGLTYLDHLHWSPDGKKFAFSYDSDHDGWLGYALMDLGGDHQMLSSSGSPDMDIIVDGWAPDNSQIYYTELMYMYYQGSYYLTETNYQIIYYLGNILSSRSYDMSLSWMGMDTVKPVSHLDAPPAYSRATGFSVKWQGQDTGPSGLRSFDVQTRVDDGPWADWLTDVADTHAIYSGQPGQTISFRSRARDYQFNLEAWPADGLSPITRLFSSLLNGGVFDNRGQPVPNASVSRSARGWEPTDTGASGRIDAHLIDTGSYSLSASHPGYAGAPQVSLSANLDQQYSLYLPPTDNILANGGFDGNLDGWTMAGGLPEKASQTLSHSGGGAVQFGVEPLAGQFGPSEPIIDQTTMYQMGALHMKNDAYGNTHIWITGDSAIGMSGLVYYQMRSPNGTWSAPLIFDCANSCPSMIDVGADGTLYLAYVSLDYSVSPYYSVSLRTKPIGQNLSAAEIFIKNDVFFSMAVGADGSVHAFYRDDKSDYYWYIRRSPSGIWSKPVGTPVYYFSGDFNMVAGADGSAYLFGTNYNTGAFVEIVHPDGTLEQPRTLYRYGDTPIPLQESNGKIDFFWVACPSQVQNCSVSEFHTFYSSLSGSQTEIERIDLGRISAIRSVATGPQGEIYLNGNQYNDGSAFLQILLYRSPEGIWTEPIQTTFVGQAMAVDPQGRLMAIINAATPQKPGLNLVFQKAQDASEASSELTQTVTIPADMHRPTLSFLYQMVGGLAVKASSVQASVSDGCTVPSFSAAGDSSGWQFGYLDLTGCEGKTVTVHLGLHQAGGEPASTLLLDEVSLGSWRSPKLTGISPIKISMSADSPKTLTLSGDNFNTPTVTIGGITFNAVVVNASTLTVDLSGHLPQPGLYDVIVTNADGSAAALPGGLQIGERLMLPLITR